uniref:Uncharacterized phage-associated protein n=1 Tax=Candidatus Kentrum sp. FW TaxID=2126338 RepID=A0A450TVB2_9GAMM|nr:MAG: Uncharacterized phage-associated protein [Candidatus Kentron sp. FW]
MNETKKADYTPSHVANFFLDKAEEEGIPITQMKLQKLVYIGYGWCLAVLDVKLFDEHIGVWQHGPVIASLYHEFKRYGSHHIAEKSVKFDLDNKLTLEPSIPHIDKANHKVIEVLTIVWNSYKPLSAWALRDKTHENGTPWSTAKNNCHDYLEDDSIKNHFHEKIQEYLHG